MSDAVSHELASEPAGGLLAKNVGLIASASLAAVIAIRLFAVARFDLPTALAVLANSGTSSVVVGLLLTSVVPLLTMAVFAVLGVWVAFRPTTFSWTALAASTVGALAMAPAEMFVSVSVILVPSVLLARFRHRSTPSPDQSDRSVAEDLPPLSRREVAAALLLGGYLTLIVLNGSPWLPAERLTVGGRIRVGYVLAHDNDELVILTERDRAIQRYRRTDVSDRRLCRVGGVFSGQRSMLSRLGDAPLVPRCPYSLAEPPRLSRGGRAVP